MTPTDGLGPQYTVTEYGLRHPDGHVESLGTDAEFRTWKAARAAVRHIISRQPVELVARTVTGRDHVISSGLLAGAPLRLKPNASAHPGVPLHVDDATDWVPTSDDPA